jgi:TonB family protein
VKTSGAVSQPELDPPIKPSRKESVTREVAIQPVVSEDVPLQAPVSTPPAKETQASPSSEAASLNVAEPEPEPFIAVEKEPQIAHLVQPQIPAIAWETSNEASIVVRVLINEEGKPVKTRVLKSSNAVVETAVVAAVMQSTFTPGIMGKSAVTSWLTVPLKFKRGS